MKTILTHIPFPWSPLVLLMLALAVAGCGPRLAPDSKRRSVDGRFAHVIAGQIPVHGASYSAMEEEIMRARIETNPRDIAARQGLAEALTRQGKHEEALETLQQLDEVMPGRFETFYQLAVVHDAMGDPGEALGEAEEAIKLRPGGHDEMGDYFVRMFRWEKSRGAGDPAVAGKNFLEIPYAEGLTAIASSPEFNQKNLVALLAAFPGFWDGYLALGDWLAADDRGQLAVRAYLRALRLNPDPEVKTLIEGRLKVIESTWRKAAAESAEDAYDDDYRKRVEDEFTVAANWAASFQTVEKELVGALPRVPPEPADDAEPAAKAKAEGERRKVLVSLKLPSEANVLAEMERRRIPSPGYFHVGLVSAANPRWGFITDISPFMWIGVGVALGAFFFAYRYAIRDRWRQRYRL